MASDEYYEWWSTHEADFSKVAFHICEKARHRCKIDGGPREEVIHLTKWRMASPQSLIGSGFASTKAIAYFASLLDHHVATAGPLPPAPPAAVTTPPPREAEPPGGRPLAHTSGLDVAALAGGRRHERGDDEAVDELLALAKDAKREPDERKRGPKMLLRALERQGVKWDYYVVIESDKNCRRCIRRTWPERLDQRMPEGGWTEVGDCRRRKPLSGVVLVVQRKRPFS